MPYPWHRNAGAGTEVRRTEYLQLGALPLSAKRCADRQSPLIEGELAAHDAAVEGIYPQLLAKATKAPQPAAKPSMAKSKSTRSAQTA